MFGVTPGTFMDINAAALAAQGFSEEEKNEWCVVQKTIMIHIEGEKDNQVISGRDIGYRPCRISDLDQALLEGYRKVL